MICSKADSTRNSIYLFSLFLFELGSLVCGEFVGMAKFTILNECKAHQLCFTCSALAPSMGGVIAGRAVAGIGAAGLFVACFQILIETTSVAARAGYLGAIGAVFSISMVAAPSIGGE